MIIDGVEWLTASEARQQLGSDITPELLRDWKRRHLIRGVRIGRHGYYRRDDLIAAEHQTRHRTRPRAKPTQPEANTPDINDLTQSTDTTDDQGNLTPLSVGGVRPKPAERVRERGSDGRPLD